MASFRRDRQTPISTDPSQLDDLKKFVEELLGDQFERLANQSLRARKLRDSTFVPHRLIYLHERMRISQQLWKKNPKTADFLAITELGTVADLFNRWKGTDPWAEICSEIRQREAYIHSLTLLLWLTLREDSGSHAELIPKDAESGLRTADCRICNEYGQCMLVEVKAPEALINPSTVLSPLQAEKIIKKVRKKAASGRKRQAGHLPSMLIIGGLFVSNSNFNQLERAANLMFEQDPPELIAAIILQTFELQCKNAIIKNGQLIIDLKKTIIKATITAQTVVNPNYKGNLKLKIRENPQLATTPQEEITEHTIQGLGAGFNNVHEDIDF